MKDSRFFWRICGFAGALAGVFVLIVFISTRLNRPRFDQLRTLDKAHRVFDLRQDYAGVKVVYEKPYATKADYCLPGESFNKVVVVSSTLPIAITSGEQMVAGRSSVRISYRLRNKAGEIFTADNATRFRIVPSLPPAHDPHQPRSTSVPLAITCPKEPGEYRYTIELIQDGVAWQSDLVPREQLVQSTLYVKEPATETNVGYYGLVWARRWPRDFVVPHATPEDSETIQKAYNMAANTLLLSLQHATYAGSTYLVASPGSAYPTVWVRDLASIQMALAHVMTSKRYLYPSWTDFFMGDDERQGLVMDWVAAAPYNRINRDTGLNDVQVDQGMWLINAVLDAQAMEITPKDWLKKPANKTGSISRIEKLLLILAWLDKERFSTTHGCLMSAHVADWGDVGLYGDDGPKSTSLAMNESPRVCGIFQQALYYQTLQRVRHEVPPDLLSAEVMNSLDERIAVVRDYAQKQLWSEAKGFFRIHQHVTTELRHDFDEDDIFALGGNVLAIKSGLATTAQRKRIIATALKRQEQYKASTIGAVLLPPYPAGTFANPIMDQMYEYQNGGQWDWYGARMATVIYRDNPKVGLTKILEIARGAVARGQFSEWYDLSGENAHGSLYYRASAAEFVNLVHDVFLRSEIAEK